MLSSKRILTLSYREKNFTDYALLIQTLRQAEKNHEITIWNSQQRPMGTAPQPEVHANIKQSSQNGKTQSGGSSGKGKRKRTCKPRGKLQKGKGVTKPKYDKNKKTAFYKCGCYNHVAKKCRNPKHLVDLYVKSAGRAQDSQKFETHFASHEMETGTSDQAPHGARPSNATTSPPTEKKPLTIDDIIVDYSTDVYGDFL